MPEMKNAAALVENNFISVGILKVTTRISITMAKPTTFPIKQPPIMKLMPVMHDKQWHHRRYRPHKTCSG